MTSLFTDWVYRKAAQRVSHDADQAEWLAILHGDSSIHCGVRDEQMSGEILEQAFSESVDADVLEEELSSRITDEIDRRAELLSDDYPFVREGNAIRHTPSRSQVYEFCLSASVVKDLSSSFGKQYQIAFERLVRDVMACHLGHTNSIRVRTGMPGDDLEDRPNVMKEIVELISGLAGDSEWNWCPDGDHPTTPAWRDMGDLGIDVVAWKPMPDKRGTNLFFLGQCACGRTTWSDKLNEPEKDRLDSWIRPIGQVPFVKFFSVPFHIPNDPYFREVAKEAKAILFDRSRLVKIANDRKNKKAIACGVVTPYGVLVSRLTGN